MRRWIVVAIALTALCAPDQVGAQDRPAADLIPPPASLGTGWDQVGAFHANTDNPETFDDAAYAVYAGPRGARVIVNVFIVAEGMTATRRSWELANDYFEGYRNEIDYDYDTSRENDLAEEPLPEGCADGRRTYGVEPLGYESFLAGVSLCAADPNVIVLTYASGVVGGFAGYRASDAAVQAVVDRISVGSGQAPVAGDLGSAEQPAPPDRHIRLGEWSIAVVDAELDATATVRAYNERNATPAPDRQLALVRVSILNLSDTSAHVRGPRAAPWRVAVRRS